MKYKLREICNGITDGSHNPPPGGEISDYPMISSKNISDDCITTDDPRYLTKAQFDVENKRTAIAPGDVLMTIVGTVGRTAVVTEYAPNLTLQRSVAVLHPNREMCSSRYLMYQLRSKRKYFETEAHGVAQKGLYLKQLSDVSIELHETIQQKEIVDTLDSVNSIIRLREAELIRLDELIKARFVEMFGNPANNIMNWPIVELETVTSVVTYGLTVRPDYIENGIDLVSARELHKGYIAYDEAPKISLEDFEKLSEKGKPQQFDILFSKTGSIGHCALVEDNKPFAITQNAARIGLKLNSVNPVWLLNYLRMDYIQDWCKSHAKGNAVKDFQLQDMKAIPLFVCPLELQNEFSEFIKQVDKSKVEVQKTLEKTQLLFDSLMQEYFGT